jgi:hypothetical protein
MSTVEERFGTPPGEKHCDDYIDDPTQPKALRRYLRYHRWPAVWQARAQGLGVKEPVLFARYNGIKVRVVMASRMGDVGITTRLDAERGYQDRVYIEDLTHFTDKK